MVPAMESGCGGGSGADRKSEGEKIEEKQD